MDVDVVCSLVWSYDIAVLPRFLGTPLCPWLEASLVFSVAPVISVCVKPGMTSNCSLAMFFGIFSLPWAMKVSPSFSVLSIQWGWSDAAVNSQVQCRCGTAVKPSRCTWSGWLPWFKGNWRNWRVFIFVFLSCQDRDQYSHLLSDHFLPYQGHNSFREKYFSGVTKRIAKEEKSSQEWKSWRWQSRKNKRFIETTCAV